VFDERSQPGILWLGERWYQKYDHWPFRQLDPGLGDRGQFDELQASISQFSKAFQPAHRCINGDFSIEKTVGQLFPGESEAKDDNHAIIAAHDFKPACSPRYTSLDVEAIDFPRI
jgi:hypothetical protein